MKILSKIKGKIYQNSKINKSADALFFLSTGRTGTTTVSRALNTIKNFTSVHEPEPKLFLSRYHIHQEGRFFSEWIYNDFKIARTEAINKVHLKGNTYVESSAFLTFHTPVISQLMPNAKFIYIHRNPFDFVRSGMRRNWYKSHPNDYCRLIPRVGTEASEKWKSWDRFNKICWLWTEFNEHCIKCYDLIQDDRKLKITSEELWKDPQYYGKIILSLMGHVDLFNNEMAELLSIKHNAQKQNKFNMPTEWSRKDRKNLLDICSATLVKLGYSY